MSSLKKNLTYQSIYQILSVLIPLVTSPYLSRILGAEGLGIYSFNYSIVHYYMLFALLGISTYGMRAIAQSNTKEDVSRCFINIYCIQIISSLVSLLAYLLLCFTVDTPNRNVLFANTFYLFGELLNISWLYFGLEEYKPVVRRNIIIKFLTVVSIFVFIRKSSDLIKYILILSVGQLLSNIILWISVKKYISFIHPSFSDIKKHIRPTLILFVPVIASSVYHIIDKTMIGVLSDDQNSGYYYNADKLLNIPLTVLVGCSNVFLTRISSLINANRKDEIQNVQNDSIRIGMFFISAVSFGAILIGKDFVPWFFGQGFDPCVDLIKVFAIIVIFKTISIHVRSTFLIPYKQDKVYAIAVSFGAVIDIVANYILIKIYSMGAMGAALGTLIAEATVCVLQIVLLKKENGKKDCARNIVINQVYVILGCVMLLAVSIIRSFISFNNIINIAISVLIGAIVYLTECLVLWRILPSFKPLLITEIINKVYRVKK